MSHLKDSTTFMEEIYCKYERLMYFIAGKYIKDPTRREDAVQTAVLALLQKEDVLRKLSDAAQVSYIAAATRNASINQCKREQREEERYISMDEVLEFRQPHRPSAETQYLEQEARQQMIAYFHTLR